jgi:hypothetical protein
MNYNNKDGKHVYHKNNDKIITKQNDNDDDRCSVKPALVRVFCSTIPCAAYSLYQAREAGVYCACKGNAEYVTCGTWIACYVTCCVKGWNGQRGGCLMQLKRPRSDGTAFESGGAMGDELTCDVRRVTCDGRRVTHDG